MKNSLNWTDLQTCVSPEGHFVFGLHEPRFDTLNLRNDDQITSLGKMEDGRPVLNTANFPAEDIETTAADTIIEVANPLPFRGASFINKRWADNMAENPSGFAIQAPQNVSLCEAIQKSDNSSDRAVENLFSHLPGPIKLAVATTSTDPEDLKLLAKSCCRMVFDKASGAPTGLVYEHDANGHPRPCIMDIRLYEAVANNPFLDEIYKDVMVLRPGAQGKSPIIGQWRRQQSHVFEYLRCNSYIPWGHYAANMANDAVRYAVGELSHDDIIGMRHLYYQRTFARVAATLRLRLPTGRNTLSGDALEEMRQAIAGAIKKKTMLPFSATLWGWNYGFDYAPSGYRLHASHQQIHQQYALIPDKVPLEGAVEASQPAFACGDMIHTFIQKFKARTGRSFFACYEQALRANKRMDNRHALPSDLVVYEDACVMVFVPKAQTAQWELQMMPLQPVGNILEADTAMRRSLDNALLVAMRTLTALGATMITVIEYSKRFHNSDIDQRLLYSFLPRLPESPGAFSEAQLRWISGHYPEDFAAACRLQLEGATRNLATP